MYVMSFGLNALLVLGCWDRPLILGLAVFVNIAAYLEKKTALASRGGR